MQAWVSCCVGEWPSDQCKWPSYLCSGLCASAGAHLGRSGAALAATLRPLDDVQFGSEGTRSLGFPAELRARQQQRFHSRPNCELLAPGCPLALRPAETWPKSKRLLKRSLMARPKLSFSARLSLATLVSHLEKNAPAQACGRPASRLACQQMGHVRCQARASPPEGCLYWLFGGRRAV